MQLPAEKSDAEAIAALRLLLERVPKRPDVWIRASENSDHIGAMVAEASLQAGLDYEAVVVPRVRRFIHAFPSTATVSGLLATIESADVATVLGINNARKCQTFSALAHLLRAEGVETPQEFRTWLSQPGSRTKLLAIKGVGVKTAAYLRLLAGLPAIAIDVHLRRAAASAGVHRSDEDLEMLFSAAADAAGLSLAEVDRSLWQHGSDNSRRRRRRRAT